MPQQLKAEAGPHQKGQGVHEDRKPAWDLKDGLRVEKSLKGLDKCYSLRGENRKVRSWRILEERQEVKGAGRCRQSQEA